MKNKKIRNATPLTYKNIHFKSQLEKAIFKTLDEQGFPVRYEPMKFTLWKGFKPTIPFYDMDKNTHLLKLQSKKLIDITYTPDFMFVHNDHLIVIEAKGFENDTFPIKKKLFRALLEKDYPGSVYFEIYAKRQLSQAIDIIKRLQ